MSTTCKTITTECTQPKTVVSNCGGPGPEGPQGPPGEISTNDETVTDTGIPVWDGTAGNLLRDSGVSIPDLVLEADLTTLLDGKVDKVTGKGLSEEDFTTALKAKLDGLSTGTFVGSYESLVLLQADHPTSNAGDYGYVVAAGTDLTVYQWDDVNGGWVEDQGAVLTGAEISALLFAEANTNNFTDSYKTQVDNSVDQATFDAAVDLVTEGLAQVTENVIVEATTARTLTLDDQAKFIRLQNAGGCTLTLPNDITGLWEDNPTIRFSIESAVLPTFLLGAGVTILAEAKLAGLAQEDNFWVKRLGPDSWILGAG